jgi:hypothetical protein
MKKTYKVMCKNSINITHWTITLFGRTIISYVSCRKDSVELPESQFQHGDQGTNLSKDRSVAAPRDLLIVFITPCPMHCSSTAQRSVRTRSETATTATALPPRRVGWGGCDILDTSDTHASTGKSAESRLGTGAGSLGAVTTGGSDLDVESRDA